MNLNLFIDQYFVHPVPFSPVHLTALVVGLMLVLAFEVWMLVDVLAFRKVPTTHRIWWVVGMFLIHPVVALVYLFARHRYKPLR